MELQDFIITRFNNIYIANNQKGRILEQKNRQRSCFIIPLSGSIKLICNGEITVTDCQHPVFIPEGLTYTNVCIEEAKSLVFNFHTLKKYDAPVSLSKISPRLATEAYQAIEKAMISDAPQNTMLILCRLYSLASELFSILHKSAPKDVIIKKATEFIYSNYTDPTLTVSLVAKHCFVSEIYLRKLFDQNLKTTPFRYITQIRMTRAHDLAKEHIPVKEIAAAVGYSDIYQFSRAYKKFYGFPPSETL